MNNKIVQITEGNMPRIDADKLKRVEPGAESPIFYPRNLSAPITVTLEMQLTIAPELLTELLPGLNTPLEVGILRLISDLAKTHHTTITVHHAHIRETATQ